MRERERATDRERLSENKNRPGKDGQREREADCERHAHRKEDPKQPASDIDYHQQAPTVHVDALIPPERAP